LSGPAGGVIGYASTCYQEGDNTPVIGFDMGGTSTDVSRYAGELEHIFESTTAGITVQSPQLDINTIAAGGGSILTWRNNMFAVGPESASSHPGPACYRKGGPLTVTDANLLLGRILPESFPKIFGPNEDQGLDVEAARRLFVQMKDRINEDVGTNMTIEEVAAGYVVTPVSLLERCSDHLLLRFLAVANESMCRPIRALTESKGHDTALHNLASFGGAGGQHAASIARILGIKRVLIHKYSSILSAYGMALAEVVHEEQAPSALKYGDDTIPLLLNELGRLEDKATSALMEQGIPLHLIRSERYLNMRYRGSDTSLMIRENASEEQDFTSLFVTSHHKQFGFTPQKASVIVDDVRVRCIGQSGIAKDSSIDDELATLKPSKQTSTVQRQVYFENHGWLSTPCHNLNELPVGAQLPGPALLIDNTQTIIVPPGTGATRLQNMVILDVGVEKKVHPVSLEVDPVQLSIFGHRFMGIAEQMGRALQKTSVSTNIKERLDFSCTVFAPDGSLVANAPHVPAMIGSMAYAVKWQIAHWKGVLKPGDVILTNSPICGGVHLPDLTTITPVFDAEGKDIIFWTASRGHHADVGGILPGSMPPNSRELWEEGAVFEAFKVVDQGVFQEDALTRKFLEPAKYPGSSGTRCLEDNVSDVRAQIAANHRGAQLIQALIRDYGFDTVQLYMREIQSAAELAVRNLLKQISREISATKLNAVDYMDDGTPIKLQITIDAQDGGATFDFTGTGGQVYGKLPPKRGICAIQRPPGS
jgi:5-oxoprolinase (ATP-hydrolysing)